mmetsp:Transcript_61958/g.134265  ORF Transcript_61958/g.134265 Transcript_61958/m.134265 type:complete len:251 (-) Transcript_61958:993-1745(-)
MPDGPALLRRADEGDVQEEKVRRDKHDHQHDGRPNESLGTRQPAESHHARPERWRSRENARFFTAMWHLPSVNGPMDSHGHHGEELAEGKEVHDEHAEQHLEQPHDNFPCPCLERHSKDGIVAGQQCVRHLCLTMSMSLRLVPPLHPRLPIALVRDNCCRLHWKKYRTDTHQRVQGAGAIPGLCPVQYRVEEALQEGVMVLGQDVTIPCVCVESKVQGQRVRAEHHVVPAKGQTGDATALKGGGNVVPRA